MPVYVKILKSVFGDPIVQVNRFDNNQTLIDQKVYTTSDDIKVFKCDNGRVVKTQKKNLNNVLKSLPSDAFVTCALDLSKQCNLAQKKIKNHYTMSILDLNFKENDSKKITK